MFSKYSMLFVTIIALLIGACARPLVSSNRNKGNSGLSDVTIKFKNDLPDGLRKRLTHYHVIIAPSDEVCKSSVDKNGAKKVATIEKTEEWPVGKDLVIKETLTRNCTYLVKLEFGEMVEKAGVKSLVGYFSNFTNKDGDLVQTKEASVTADITVLPTKEGIAAGLDKFTESISSVTETDLSIDVTFGSAGRLSGTYALACVPDGAMQAKWLNRTMTISGDTLVVKDQIYDNPSCADLDLVSEELTEAKIKMGKRDGSSNPIDLTLISKTFNVTARFSGAHCGSTSFVKGTATDVLSLAECKLSAGPIAIFDIMDLSNNALSFGKKDQPTVDGSTADKRPKVLDLTANAMIPKKS